MLLLNKGNLWKFEISLCWTIPHPFKLYAQDLPQLPGVAMASSYTSSGKGVCQQRPGPAERAVDHGEVGRIRFAHAGGG